MRSSPSLALPLALRTGDFLLLDETAVDPKVGVMLIILLGDQELFGEFRYLGLIVR